MMLINTVLYVFLHSTDQEKNIDQKYQVHFKSTAKNFKIDNIKRGASVIGSAGSGKNESIVFGFLKHFQKYGFCGVIHDYKDFELTEMAYPLFKKSNIPFKVVSFDKIVHRVNPIAPRYLENEESVNEISRVLIENLLEQKESGTSEASKFFNDAAEGLIGGLIWKLKISYPQFCSLPHLIAIYQILDTDSLIAFLSSNRTSRAMADAFISGKDSERQTAGVKSTLANALKRISTQSIFMVLSADEVPLDINNTDNQSSYTLFFNKPSSVSSAYGTAAASLADVSRGEVYTFAAFAKVSASAVSSVGRLRIFELDSNEDVVNWDEDDDTFAQKGTPTARALGGIKTSQDVGLNETEWQQISVTKTIKYPQTAKLGVRFENVQPNTAIYWDDVSLRKGTVNTDGIGDTFNYNLFVKKYEAGLDRAIYASKTTMTITGSNVISQSYNASWTGSGDLFIGGSPSDQFGNQLTGSIMEFRLWNEPLQEQHFDTHVANPKSYVGNSASSSYYSLTRRYSFDDNTTLVNGAAIRDVSADQTDTLAGYAFGFAGANTFENVEDKTKTMVPNYGPNRRTSTKIRIENNVLSGSGANLSINKRYDVSSNDFAPLDSPKVGIYFSPTDVVNEDIILSFANLDFNEYLGDPRDNFKLQYSELKDASNEYFQKYSGKNDFWDYMRLIKYYDQSLFKQMRKLLPARSKAHMGTVIEPNIFERPKVAVQRNHPSFTQPQYEKNINLTNFHFNDDSNNEQSHSVFKIETEYPNYEGTIEKETSPFSLPSLYRFDYNSHLDEIATYVSASVKFGTDRVFQEVTGSVVENNRLSDLNLEYKYFYTSSIDYMRSQRYTIDNFLHLYSSKSLVETDLDTNYQHNTATRRLFFEGCKNTKLTTTDGDYPVIIRTTSPTIALPTDSADSNLKVVDDKLK